MTFYRMKKSIYRSIHRSVYFYVTENKFEQSKIYDLTKMLND